MVEETYRTGYMPPVEKAGGMAWLMLVFLIQAIDLFVRYRGGPVNFYTWSLFFVIYAIIALRFNRKWKDTKVIFVCYFLTAFLFPFLYPKVVPYLGGSLGAMIIAFNPVWVIYLLMVHSEYYPRLSFVYMVFWIALLTFSFMPQAQLYAQEQGYSSATYSPAIAVRYMASTAVKAGVAVREAVSTTQKEVAKEAERTMKVISGDYYTGEVDKSTEKPRGIFLTPLESTQPEFKTGQTVTVYSTLKAERIEEPIGVRISCTADNNPADEITKTEFTIEQDEEKSIDCKFKNLPADTYDFKLTAEFPFTTRSYQLVYTMDKEKLRESRRQNENPLKDFKDKDPATQYSSGPVMIGMGADIGKGKQPYGVPDPATGDTAGPTIGVTIDNLWTGKVKEIDYIILLTPKGIEVSDINGLPTVQIPECSLMPTEIDKISCDDTVNNMYYVPQEVINEANEGSDVIAYTFRVYTQITDYAKLVGAEALPKNFKVTARYKYIYSAKKTMTIKEAKIAKKTPAETKPPEP